jgi:two-component system, cell cycle sensor histidine kinase and response regulator CckA
MKWLFSTWANVVKPGKEPKAPVLAIVVTVLVIGLFVLELQVPVDVEVWLPNVAVVLLSLWFPYRWQTYLTTAICSILTILGLIFSPYVMPTWVTVLNRFLGIMVFWVTAWMGLAARRTAELEAMNMRLRQEIAERQRGEEKLAEQASLLDLAQDAILVRDMDHRIVFWNHGAERLYGWTAQEAIGRNAIELLLQAHDPDVSQAQRELLLNGKWIGALRQITKDGRSITVESHWTLVRDSDDVPKSILIVNTDVTEKMAFESQLLRAQRLESVGILAGGVAHDFNNLLTPILMAVKLLREVRPENERQNLLTTLQASAERGAEMVRKLLSFAGGGETAMNPVQLRYIIKEITSIIDHSFPKTIAIATRLDDRLSSVLADSTQLSQVLMNLCVNARDAMPDGGKLTITAENVRLDADSQRLGAGASPGPYVLLTVSDTGAGIPKEIINRIFDPFFSTKEHGKRSGLGLSSVLGIVRSHGGFIDVESEVGKGSHFAVYLPATTEASPRPIVPTRPPPPRGHGELILVVDDEDAILTTVKATLEDNNYRVVTAPNGAAAVNEFAARKGEIQLVLLDMMMPGMDGLSTMTALRQLLPSVRVVAASGLRPVGQLAIAIGARKVDFLQKPYSDEQLLTTLRHALERTS